MFSPFATRIIIFQISGSTTFVPLWCSNFNKKFRKSNDKLWDIWRRTMGELRADYWLNTDGLVMDWKRLGLSEMKKGPNKGPKRAIAKDHFQQMQGQKAITIKSKSHVINLVELKSLALFRLWWRTLNLVDIVYKERLALRWNFIRNYKDFLKDIAQVFAL